MIGYAFIPDPPLKNIFRLTQFAPTGAIRSLGSEKIAHPYPLKFLGKLRNPYPTQQAPGYPRQHFLRVQTVTANSPIHRSEELSDIPM